MTEIGIDAGLRILRALKAGRAVLADYDLEVIGDMTEVDGSTEDHPKWKLIFYIGQRADRSAGLNGFWLACAEMSSFETVDLALIWAGAHEDKIRKEMDIEA